MKNPSDPKTRGRVDLEEVPEETYKDLLPYEMEGAEFAANLLRGTSEKLRKKYEKKVKTRVFGSFSAASNAKIVAESMATEARVEEGITKAKDNSNNAWGHPWRQKPTPEGMTKKRAQERLNKDPVRDRAVAEYKAERKTPEELLQSIQMLLFWDYETDDWRAHNIDPNWNGYDELAEIADRLSHNGFGPGMTRPKK